eukprot:g3296.t1
MRSGVSFYLHLKSTEPRPINRLAGFVIESIAWNKRDCTDDETGDILIGTKRGQIYVSNLSAGKKKIPARVVLDVRLPVCGLHIEHFPFAGSWDGEVKIFVMAVTARPTRYYEFVGGSDLDALFAVYRTDGVEDSSKLLGNFSGTTEGALGKSKRGIYTSELFDGSIGGGSFNTRLAQYMELPSNLERSELHFFSRLQKIHGQATAKTFAVLTDVGVYHGRLQFSSQNPGDKVVMDETLLPISSNADSFAMTEFHFVLIDRKSNSISVTNALDERTAFERTFDVDQEGRLLGVVGDPLHSTLWVFTDAHIFQLAVVDESRYVWQIYLDKASHGEAEHFGTALKFCTTDSQREAVTLAQANFYFKRGSFKLASKYFAISTISFEEAALKLINAGQTAALELYLQEVLLQCDEEKRNVSRVTDAGQVPSYNDSTNRQSENLYGGTFQVSKNNKKVMNLSAQQTMLCTWLTEILLGNIDEAENHDDIEEMEQGVSALKHFLKERHGMGQLDQVTTASLIEAHGRRDLILFYARLTKDYETLISHHILQCDYHEAVQVLSNLNAEMIVNMRLTSGFRHNDIAKDGFNRNKCSPSQYVSKEELTKLFCKYSLVLMEHVPKITVDTWIEAPWLDPVLFIPALIKYSEARHRHGTTKIISMDNNSEKNYMEYESLKSIKGNEAVRYLKFIIEVVGSKSMAIHNYLISIYARISPLEVSDTVGNEKVLAAPRGTNMAVDAVIQQQHPLLHFITKYSKEPFFDVQYALRVCSVSKQTKACALLYELLGCHSEAVTVALSSDPPLLNLAKQCANSSRDRDERRKLWLQIAEMTIKGAGRNRPKSQLKSGNDDFNLAVGEDIAKDIAKAVEILSECQEANLTDNDNTPLLRIEDVLPFFPPFDVIDDFKLAICQSLRNYNGLASALDDEMTEYTETAKRIRYDLDSLGDRYGFVGGTQTCEICGDSVLGRPFFLFPCTHVFHCDCLENEMKLHVPMSERKKTEKLQKKLSNLLSDTTSQNVSMEGKLAEIEQTRNEIESIVASECLYCSDIMIESVSEPFVASLEMEAGENWGIQITVPSIP